MSIIHRSRLRELRGVIPYKSLDNSWFRWAQKCRPMNGETDLENGKWIVPDDKSKLRVDIVYSRAAYNATMNSLRLNAKLRNMNGNAVKTGRNAKSLLASEEFRGAKMIRLEYYNRNGKLKKFNGRVTYSWRMQMYTVVSNNGKRAKRHFESSDVQSIRYSRNLGFDVVRLRE